MTRQKIGVFLPNWIGDVVMATPALRALYKRFAGEAELVGIHRPYVREVLVGTPWLSRYLSYLPTRTDSLLAPGDLVRRLCDERFDTLLLFTHSFMTARLAYKGRARERIGFAGNLRTWMLTTALPKRPKAGSAVQLPDVDAYLQLVYALGCPPEEKRLALATTADDECAADEVWRRFGLPGDGRVVVFNGGGGSGAVPNAKAWPAEQFGELAHRIVERYDWHVLVNCGPADRVAAAKIAESSQSERVHSLAAFPPEALTLGLTKACLRRSGLVVTGDCGPRHIATAFDRPVIALFGPTDHRRTETYHPGAVALRHALPCAPCEQIYCPLGHHACMRELTAESVFAAVARHIEGRSHVLLSSGVVRSPDAACARA